MNKFHSGRNVRPTLVISDVHGSMHWKTFLKQRRHGERVVFLGDYFDRRGKGPFASSEAENFAEICGHARHEPDIFLLLGNHDFDCMPFTRCKIYPMGSRERANQEAIMENIDLLEIIHIDDGIIFSHGGLTQAFLNNNKLEDPGQVNEFWRLHPERFDFYDRDPVTGQWSERSGDDPWQSPIWARPAALIEDGIKGFDQVVGHTPVKKPAVLTIVNGDQILFTCTLDHTLIRIGGKE